MLNIRPRHGPKIASVICASLILSWAAADDLQQTATALQSEHGSLLLQLSQAKSDLSRLADEGIQWGGTRTDALNEKIRAHNTRIANLRSSDSALQGLRNSYFQLGNSVCQNSDWAQTGSCSHPDPSDPRAAQMHQMAAQILSGENSSNAASANIDAEANEIKARAAEIESNMERIDRGIAAGKVRMSDIGQKISQNEAKLKQVQTSIEVATPSARPAQTTTATPSLSGDKKFPGKGLAARVKVFVASFMQPAAVLLMLPNAFERSSRVRG